MRYLIVFWLLFLIGGVCPAFATGETMVRHPTFSSIPCRGILTEVRTEEGNVYNAMNATFIACLDSPDHAQWLVEASVQCEVSIDDLPESNDNPACSAPQAAPIALFVTQPKDQPNTNIYQLGRYVFASDCVKAHTIVKGMEALSNKVTFSTDDTGWVCHQVNKVDSLKTFDNEGKDLGSKNFRYARITTRGPEEQMNNDDTSIGQWILGVDVTDQRFQVEYDHHHLEVK
ncbi:exported protein of unknown function [Beijerinckiaceae bacterium RH AL1]|nr:exported protein of unknown function [Beijerinckiaceae bacterium RH CH11]VVB49327.1 exported protein of unknown function [Beijerinckiaceae bacterium RH AL8]VVC56803.1 exported protein of unknown function [Beijerinckiaceae bacterium RH AL1]